jgi:hypothetical protein
VIVYAQEKFPREGRPSVFLAGPTPRSGLGEVESWRGRAVQVLANAVGPGDLDVYVPEDRSGLFNNNYNGQVDWEWDGLELADVVLFWVPRDMAVLPGLTTNTEFGYVIRSGKVAYGRPSGAPGTRYLDRLARRHGVEPQLSLVGTLAIALDRLKYRLPGRA